MTDVNLQRENMVESQVRPSDITDRRITSAMRSTARERFVPASMSALAYMDTELPLSTGRSMTAPRDLARLLQLAEIEPTDKVLVVGGARGYTAAIVSQLAAAVVSLECDAEMSAAASATLQELQFGNVTTAAGALANGAPDQAQFHVIVVDGMISDLPDAFISQLSPGGRIVCVMSDRGVACATLFTKTDRTVARRTAFEAAAGPLPGLVLTVRPFSF